MQQARSSRRYRARLLVAGVALVTVGVVPATANATAAPVSHLQIPTPSVARYVVRADTQQAALTAAAAATALGGHVVRSFSHAIDGFSADLNPRQAAVLAARPGVVSVDTNKQFHTTTTQTDPTWGLDLIDETDRGIDHSYSYTETGTGVTAYVVDTGIFAEHPDFTGRVNAGFSAIDGAPADHDCVGHGTHVSGTVGGTIYGVAKNVHITPVRVFACDPFTTLEAIITGLDWVVADHQSGDPAVLNMSLGGYFDATLNAATTAVVEDGVFVSVAAGNDDVDACTESPSSAFGVVVVGAIDRHYSRPDWSNFGSCVDLNAPGVEVTSDSYTGGFVTYSGTSMASPHVAGTAARFLSAHPTATPLEVSSALISSAGTYWIVGNNLQSTDAVLYADAADATTVPSDAADPSTPANVQAVALDATSVHVLWDASTDDGAVAGYAVFRDGSLTPVALTRGTDFYDTDPTLDPATTYTYTVEAIDRAGNASDASADASATTSEFTPAPPVIVDSIADVTVVGILFGDPNPPGAVANVEVYRDGHLVDSVNAARIAAGQGLFIVFDVGRQPGTSYEYEFRSIDNWSTTGEFATKSFETLPDGEAPSIPHLRATPDATQVQLAWSGASDDVAVVSYRVYRGTTLIKTLGASKRAFAATGLHADTNYVFSVRAVDASGNASVAGTARTRTQPRRDGYWMLGANGSVTAFALGNFGSDTGVLGAMNPAAAAIAARPDGRGYWTVDRRGRVFAHGTSPYLGGATLGAHERAVAIASSATGNGYWVASNLGRVFPFGDAPHAGPNAPASPAGSVVGMTRTASGHGYWLALANGGVYGYGDARFYGSVHGPRHPIAAIARTPSGKGYWIAASDGGVYGYGDAHFYGSAAGKTGGSPVVAIASAPNGKGYWLFTARGGVFAFGSAPFRGIRPASAVPVVGAAGR